MPVNYDVIIIGSGAGGGTLARQLAPTGKQILILERGDWMKREALNCTVPFLWTTAISRIAGTTPRGGHSSHRAIILWRRRRCTGCVVSLAPRFRRASRTRRHLAGMAHHLRQMEPFYTKAEQMYQVHGLRGVTRRNPTRARHIPIRPFPMSRASNNCWTI